MRVPFVSRWVFDLMCDGYARLAQRDADTITDLKARLAEQTQDLRTARAELLALATPPAAPIPLPHVPKEQNIVSATIHALAQGDPRLANYFHQRKRDIRSEHPNMSDEAVAQLLTEWETSDSALPPTD